MQLLTVLPHYKDMVVQLSLTGATVLTQSKFKARHGGSKEIVQRPDTGLLLKKNEQKSTTEKFKSKKRKKLPTLPLEAPVKKISQQRFYSVNKKEVTHRIRNFVNSMTTERKLYFWTITFPPTTTDDTAFILFNKWLTRCRKELNLRSYLWVTERQTGERLNDESKKATGTIHFHIAVHQRICVQKANRFMRACIFTSIDNGEINYSRTQAKNYNGVDIAKDRNTKRVINFAKKNKQKSLVNYITKYVTKNNGSFTHLAWHSSRDYSNLITSIRITMDEYIQSGFRNRLQDKPTIISEWFSFFAWTADPPSTLLQYLSYVNEKARSLFNGTYNLN
jgi:hypothetical protein